MDRPQHVGTPRYGRKRLPPLACPCGQKPSGSRSNDKRHFKTTHGWCPQCQNYVVPQTHRIREPRHQVQPADWPPAPVHGVLHDRCSEDQARIPSKSTSSTSTPTLVDSRFRRTLWCLIPEHVDLRTASSSITLHASSFTSGLLPWIATDKDGCQKLVGLYGEQFIHTGQEQDEVFVHQSLMTPLICQAYSSSFTIRLWSLVEDLLANVCLHHDLELCENDDLYILIADTGVPEKEIILKRYELIQQYIRIIGPTYSTRIQPYPGREEAVAEGDKVSDIQALDRVAETLGTWRPTTCYGGSQCRLLGQLDVLKRSWSGMGNHVDFEGRNRHRLTCRVAETFSASHHGLQSRRKTRKLRAKPIIPKRAKADLSHWFHQQRVESLMQIELRVFIVTSDDFSGFRGRSGRVIRICATRPEAGREDGLISAAESNPSTYGLLGATAEQVEKFALHTFEAIRQLHDPCFESLEVGCRLDIGMGPADSWRPNGPPLFVNEITRWYGASYFSDLCLGEPHTLICEEFAAAWRRYSERQNYS